MQVGETVTFIVRNVERAQREFVLGDRDYQEMHGADSHAMEGSDNAVSVAASETNRLTWRFDVVGEVLYGCHEPGHYEGGMVGTIEVDD